MTNAPGSDAILPCPFCGSDAEEHPELCGGDFAVRCTHDECGCSTGLFDDPRDSLRVWNTRPPLAGEAVAWEHLRLKLVELIREQSEGEWDEPLIQKDAKRFADALWPLITHPAPKSARAPAEWRDIASAPKDGTTILLYSPMWEHTWGSVQAGMFRDGAWETSEGSVGEDEIDGPYDEEGDDDYEPPMSLGPSHWMPLPAPPTTPTGEGESLHPATADLVRRFADALAAKLRRAEAKYGWTDGWARDDWADQCRSDLTAHVTKGDPLDVAAYAAFCWHHGWSTTPAPSRLVEAAREDGAKLLATVKIYERPDGGLSAFSDDLPGLILSGSRPEEVGACIVPAIYALRSGG